MSSRFGMVRAGVLALAASGMAGGLGVEEASADYDPPRGAAAVGYGPEVVAGLGYGHGPRYALTYHTKSQLYGYPDFAYGRGPLINLGGASLQPGFRGYGVFGPVGYGVGMYPSTWTDQRPGLFHRLKARGGHGSGW
ncbi:hypothetical protein [Tautonia sociabilis]|uniref:hypothetical protein n=1 Tax=Tautonia sociabilis TaxID=2080755 RepID=UPI001315380A|nr:hypothetical protein [Tautonia sociabilis]